MAATMLVGQALTTLSAGPSSSLRLASSIQARNDVFRSFSGLGLSGRLESGRAAGTSSQAVAPLRPGFLTVEAKVLQKKEVRKKRHLRIRKKLSGTPERPRMAVYRSNQHLYVQVIDDTASKTLCASSTLTPALKEELGLSAGPTIAAATRIGKDIGERCLAQGITKVAFDRGGFLYHGRVKALADAARETGLDF